MLLLIATSRPMPALNLHMERRACCSLQSLLNPMRRGGVVRVQPQGLQGRWIDLPGRLQAAPLLEALNACLRTGTPETVDCTAIEPEGPKALLQVPHRRSTQDFRRHHA